MALRLERSVLSLPASDWPRIQAHFDCQADLVIIDLDDTVAWSQKVAARPNVIRALREISWHTRVRGFRMNAVSTPLAYRDLVEVVESAGEYLDLVVVPKVDRPDDVYFVDMLLSQIEETMGLKRHIGVEAQIETSLGMINVDRIAFASPRLESLVFGPGDYAASIEMPVGRIGEPDEWDADYPGHRWHYALHRLLVAARAARLRAIDGPIAGKDNPEAFRQSARLAYSLGFDGKWCTRCDQVLLANEVFVPDAGQIQQAREMIQVYRKAVADGELTVQFAGTVVDAARIKVAELTLQKARLAGLQLDEL